MVGIRHLTWSGGKLPNSHIEHVIDVDCPPLLSSIRRKHRLPAGAFIVPADAHDYLMDKGLLKDMFGDVHGGNILDDTHMDNMMESLTKVEKGKKVAISFFYCEHVTAVLRVSPDSGFGVVRKTFVCRMGMEPSSSWIHFQGPLLAARFASCAGKQN